MAKPEDKASMGADEGRRSFLKLSAAAPAVAAAAAMGAETAEAAEAAPQKGGLKDTAHTRAFYETARF